MVGTKGRALREATEKRKEICSFLNQLRACTLWPQRLHRSRSRTSSLLTKIDFESQIYNTHQSWVSSTAASSLESALQPQRLSSTIYFLNQYLSRSPKFLISGPPVLAAPCCAVPCTFSGYVVGNEEQRARMRARNNAIGLGFRI